jgi:DEAD/DEAH box helicase domain-containing protein
MERAEIRGPKVLSEIESTPTLATTLPLVVDQVEESSTLNGDVDCTFAGCGAVTVKRSVHGYKKLSLITRAELSRSELSLPPLEFDTFGLWIDTDASTMAPILGEVYGPGVHALSHAILAVAPLFAPGLVRSDLECDHSFYEPTKVMMFDERAGGSGSCDRLWKSLFYPESLLDAAVELLEECASCRRDSSYDGGCPACLHASNCIQFNSHLSRSAGAVIGKRIIQRIQETDLYQQFAKAATEDPNASKAADSPITPRRKARSKALEKAKEMRSARDRQFVVGRPSWPLDGDERQFKQVYGD